MSFKNMKNETNGKGSNTLQTWQSVTELSSVYTKILIIVLPWENGIYWQSYNSVMSTMYIITFNILSYI